jgi:hypothetical protein
MKTKTAEEQIWEAARQIEKTRVMAQHARMQAEGKLSKAEYAPEKISKPWTWGSSAADSLHDLDPDLVFSVSEFDFNLENTEFTEFLEQKFHIHLCRESGSSYWLALNCHQFTKLDFLADQNFQFAQEYRGTRYRYSENEMLIQWKIFHFTKVFLQGAYDRFLNRTI